MHSGTSKNPLTLPSFKPDLPLLLSLLLQRLLRQLSLGLLALGNRTSNIQREGDSQLAHLEGTRQLRRKGGDEERCELTSPSFDQTEPLTNESLVASERSDSGVDGRE